MMDMMTVVINGPKAVGSTPGNVPVQAKDM
jgi:hypothetical protein